MRPAHLQHRPTDRKLVRMTTDNNHHIRVEAQSTYVREQSQPEQDQYVFSYTITIRNIGEVAAQLMSRHWIITNGDGGVQEVRGDGVVGEQPHLGPGDSFRYTSGAMLETPVGSMHGSYLMRTDDGTEFKAPIPTMRLFMPNSLH